MPTMRWILTSDLTGDSLHDTKKRNNFAARLIGAIQPHFLQLAFKSVTISSSVRSNSILNSPIILLEFFHSHYIPCHQPALALPAKSLPAGTIHPSH